MDPRIDLGPLLYSKLNEHRTLLCMPPYSMSQAFVKSVGYMVLLNRCLLTRSIMPLSSHQYPVHQRTSALPWRVTTTPVWWAGWPAPVQWATTWQREGKTVTSKVAARPTSLVKYPTCTVPRPMRWLSRHSPRRARALTAVPKIHCRYTSDGESKTGNYVFILKISF